MRKRIFLKWLAAFLVVIAATAVIVDFSIRHAWETSLRLEIERDLRQKTVMFANRVKVDRKDNLADLVAQEGQAAGARATVIDLTGRVLADSEVPPSSLDHVNLLPEFAAALKGEVGMDRRRSPTVGTPFVYVAAPVSGGAVRLAYSLSDVEAATAHGRVALLLGATSAFVAAMILAGVAAQMSARRWQRIIDFAGRIAAGDLTTRIADSRSDEFGQVAAALDASARQLELNFVALQNSQRQLETLLNSMQDAVIAVDPDQRVQWANQSMDRLIPQRTRRNAPVVETVRDPDFLHAVRGAIESRAVLTARATSILPARTFEVTAAPMPGGGAVAVLRDLTETERVEKTRRDFIANVSHELRTPLTSIQGYTETLLDSASGNEAEREFLEIIRKNATRMARLTEDLLRLARVESGEQRFDIQPVAPGELLQEAVQSFREIARAQKFELQIADASTGEVNADREAVHQVFSNLIDNALKYAAGSGRIVLGAQSSGRSVEFYVQDFGPGIPSEHLHRLFERFYRVDKARSRESGGTGLGLAIAKHIMLAHGGTIRAESDLNHGSTFLFTLPLAP
ncbi:MAG TPA: ATP-binding protein [Terriglobales bacterium]|nr:ATP-binding protein [Terriglobales bacterium]